MNPASQPASNIAGVVLCGGRSRRMGAAKAGLDFGGQSLLARVVGVLAPLVQPVVVVAAESQELPPLPPGVLIARDTQPGRGPLQGIAGGLAAAAPFAAAAYVASCDAPLLEAAFVREILRRFVAAGPGCEIAVAAEGEFVQPLAAVYRTSLVERIQELLAEERLRPLFLMQALHTLRIPVEELRAVDPELRSLRNVNTPADYVAALAACGFTADPALLAALQAAAETK